MTYDTGSYGWYIEQLAKANEEIKALKDDLSNALDTVRQQAQYIADRMPYIDYLEGIAENDGYYATYAEWKAHYDEWKDGQ